jgi:hypothetical protein
MIKHVIAQRIPAVLPDRGGDTKYALMVLIAESKSLNHQIHST